MSRRAVAVAFCVVLLLAASCSGDDDGSSDAEPASAADEAEDVGATTTATSPQGDLTLQTSSTRADAVSGGNVLVTVSGGAVDTDVSVTAGDRDVTGAGSVDEAGDGLRWRGLIEDLDEGDTTLEATSGDETVALTVTNHPTSGPIFSGPHLDPWICTAEELGLDAPTDDDCSAPTEVTWSYQTESGEVRPLRDPSELPTDVATTTVRGQDVPLVFRAEQGVINRGVYWIWVLDPEPAEEAWDSTAWNRRLVYRFGGGCGTSYSQGSPLGTGLDTDLLKRGYALATNTLNTFQSDCNSTLSAEAALMTREHFVEAYGVPRFTIGDGGSGGAVQQLLIGQNQPGLLDALSPSLPFPDAVSIAGGVSDCGLLVAYFDEEGSDLTDEQRAAIGGNVSAGTCPLWDSSFVGGVNPFDGCSADIPADEIYDPDDNPDGTRCTLQDINVNTLGVDPDTGFTRRPLSNEGVQYGLLALEDGTIDAEEFVSLNEDIGGYDIDGQIVDERATMTEETAAGAYGVGAITGPGPLQDVPIILRQPYTDPGGDIHTRYHAFSIRERLASDGSDDPNLALWTSPAPTDPVSAALTGSVGNNDPIFVLDQWLTDGERPEEADNRCVLPDGTTVRGGWELYDDPGPCSEAYPVAGDPRTVAGGPRTGDVIACALAPISEIDADLDLTPAQLERLEVVFPNGVCDWSAPGIGVQAPEATWQDFGS